MLLAFNPVCFPFRSLDLTPSSFICGEDVGVSDLLDLSLQLLLFSHPEVSLDKVQCLTLHNRAPAAV